MPTGYASSSGRSPLCASSPGPRTEQTIRAGAAVYGQQADRDDLWGSGCLVPAFSTIGYEARGSPGGERGPPGQNALCAFGHRRGPSVPLTVARLHQLLGKQAGICSRSLLPTDARTGRSGAAWRRWSADDILPRLRARLRGAFQQQHGRGPVTARDGALPTACRGSSRPASAAAPKRDT